MRRKQQAPQQNRAQLELQLPRVPKVLSPPEPDLPRHAPHWFTAGTASPAQRRHVYEGRHPCGGELQWKDDLGISATCGECRLAEHAADIGTRCSRLDRVTAWQASRVNQSWPACEFFLRR